MNRIRSILLIGLAVAACSKPLDLNERAAKEYLEPVRPFTEGRNPCWNEFCNRFIYAPVFDFGAVEGAAKYVYTVTGGYTFTAGTPNESLAPIWSEIPVGEVALTVEAFDAQGASLGLCSVSQGKKGMVTERTFMRDFPFHGPYPGNIRPYREAALMGLLYIHRMPQIQAWKDSDMPDMSYSHNTYANKIIGRTVASEARLATLCPQYADEALAIARNAAKFLMDHSRPEGEVLAFFPPTYYGGLIASAKESNKGKMIPMDACYAATGFLDLYDATLDTLYLNQALRMAGTYARLQREDGSMPIKCRYETGEPVNEVSAMLHPVLNFLRRLHNQYGVEEFEQTRMKGEKWMKEVALKSFDMTGQFEDVTVEGLRPYSNLTNCTAAPFASYLLNGTPDASDIADPRDLIRVCEDQFVHWDALPGENGIRRIAGPCVYEQLHYQTPVDNSSCNVANALLDYYEVTGDTLAFVKAKALVDQLTIAQDMTTGFMPTTIQYRNRRFERSFWLNCANATINTWLRMAEMTGEQY